MSDITQIMQLPGARLDRVEQDGTTVRLHFSEVHLVQEMDGAFEDSLWTQALTLSVDNAEITGALPDSACELAGGDLSDNIYTYRDHAPLPIDWRGDVGCKLSPATGAAEFSLRGTHLKVEQIDHPTYLRHVSKDSNT